MTAEEFEATYGRPPVKDDLHRVNCEVWGKIGHYQCGLCDEHAKPRFMCGCFYMKETPESIMRDLREFKARVMREDSPAMTLAAIEEIELAWAFGAVATEPRVVAHLLRAARELAELRETK